MTKGARDANDDSPLSWARWHVRPPLILRHLTFGTHAIHPENPSTYDHDAGWTVLDLRGLVAKP